MGSYIDSRSLLFAAYLIAFSFSSELPRFHSNAVKNSVSVDNLPQWNLHCAQELTLGFGENDYSTREAPQSTISVTISVQGQASEDVMVKVIPVTFEQYRSRFGSIPSDIRLLENVDTAEVTDFNNETMITRILAGSGNADHHISIEIYDDNIQEQDEAFLLYIEVGDTTQQIEFPRNVSVARIRDNDIVTIGFGGSALLNRQISEDAGTLNDSLYIIRVGETEQTLTIRLQFSGFGATNGVDLAVNETFVLDPQNDRVAVPIVILDDTLPEYEEIFELVIQTSPNEFSLQQRFISLTIIDNDALVVGFDSQTSATVNVQEGRSVQFCIAILTSEQTAREVDLNVLTQPGNATENYYELLDTRGMVSLRRSVYIALTNDIRESCVDVRAVEDETLEWSRSFIVKLEHIDQSALNILNSSQVTVLITDNDGTPSRPMLLMDRLGLVNGGKDLYFEWIAEEDVRRPIASYFGSINSTQVETTNSISRRQATTGQLQFSTPNTYFIIPNIDQEKELVLQVCSRNEFGFNCSTPVRFHASDLPFIPDTSAATSPVNSNNTVPPTGGIGNPTGLAPGIIAVIIIVVLVFLLVFCCLLLLLICLLRPSLYGEAYSPSKIEKKKSSQYEEYRNERSPSIESESDDDGNPV